MLDGETIGGLAAAAGLPADALGATVDRWNAHVADGADLDFGRGESAYDGWNAASGIDSNV
jgi:hypothetical protein